MSRPWWSSCGQLLHSLCEHRPAMGVVAEHVEARACGGEQHGVTGLRRLCSRAHGVLQSRAGFQGADARERFGDGGGIASNQYGVTDLSTEDVGELGKILVLPVSARDHDERAPHATYRSDGGADIGPL